MSGLKRKPCEAPGCDKPTSMGLTFCTPCAGQIKRRHFQNHRYDEMLAVLDALSRRRALSDDESFLLELAIRRTTASKRDVARKRRGRPFGSVTGGLGPAIDNRHIDSATYARIARSSNQLLKRMLEVGARSCGCLALSADECRARLGIAE